MDIIENLRQLNLKYADQAAEIIESLREDRSFWHIKANDFEERLLSIEQAHIDAIKDNMRLRKALKEIMTHEGDYDPIEVFDIARAALKENE